MLNLQAKMEQSQIKKEKLCVKQSDFMQFNKLYFYEIRKKFW